MTTQRILRALFGCLALAASLTHVSAQGATPQTLIWEGTPGLALDLNTPYALRVTASSGLPVTLRLDAGLATLANGALTVTGEGKVVVTAEQLGDASYLPARETRTFHSRVGLLTSLGRSLRGSGVQVVGEIAYIAGGSAGLHVVDIRNPAAPARLGGFDTSGEAYDVKVVGNLAYVADGTAGLQVIDVGDPANPRRLGGYNTTGNASRLHVVRNLVYVADGAAGFQVIDVGNPANPVRLGGFNTSGTANDVKVVGSVAYVADGPAGLRVFDVSNPAAPTALGGLATPNGSALELDVMGDILHLAAGFLGLMVIDVADPARPVQLSLLGPPLDSVEEIFNPREVAGVRVVGGIAHVTRASFNTCDLDIVDVSDPANPARMAALKTTLRGNVIFVGRRGVEASGGMAYFFNADGELEIVDVRLGYQQTISWAAPAGPILELDTAHPLGATASSGLPVTLRVSSGSATLANGQLTVTGPGMVQLTAEQPGDETYFPARDSRVYNVLQARLKRLAKVDVAELASALDVAGNLVYVARSGTGEDVAPDVGGGLQVVDVGDPARPVVVGSLDIPSASDVQVVGSSAYVVGYDNQFHVIDIANPSQPARVGGVAAGGVATVAGHYAYVGWGGGLKIFDIANPASPAQVGAFVTNSVPTDIAVSGNYAYVLFGGSLQILNVANPAQPVRIGGFAPAFPSLSARKIKLEGNLAFLATSGSLSGSPLRVGFGFQVVDVSNPARPTLVGSYDAGGSVQNMDVAGNLVILNAYLGAQTRLQIVDVSNPAAPVRLEVVQFRSYAATDLKVVGNKVLMTTGSGLHVFELEWGYSQTLSWSGLAERIPTLNTPYPLSVTASSGLPVTVRVESGPAFYANGALTVTGPGLVRVRAEQPGGGLHESAGETRHFNASLPRPTLASQLSSAGEVQDVEIAGSFAYVADLGIWDGNRHSGGSFSVVDISNPAQLSTVGRLATSKLFYDVAVSGHLALVADHGVSDGSGNFVDGGLRVIDVSNPANPAIVGEVPIGNQPTGVAVSGNYAYVLSHNKLFAVNISNPANPNIEGVGEVGDGSWTGLDIANGHAYVCAYSGLVVMDLTDPAHPARLSWVETRDIGHGVQVVGSHAYVAVGPAGLDVVDVSNPAQPVWVGGTSAGMGAPHVRVADNIAVLPTWGGPLRMVDVSNPSRPAYLGEIAEADAPHAVGWSEGYLYAFGVEAGMKAIKIDLRAVQPLKLELSAKVAFPGHPVARPAIAPSGLPLTFSVVDGPASVVNQQLVLTGLGPVTLRADQPGDDLHLPVSLEWSFTVVPPNLGVRLAAGQEVELAWIAGLPGLKLQRRESLAPDGLWTEVAAPFVEANGMMSIVIPAGGSTGFFRLGQP